MADVSISSKASLVLDLPPSCIQFCPAHPEYFVIGTYNLQKENNGGQPVAEADSEVGEQPAVELEKAQTRNGTLVVYKIDGSRLTHIQTISQPSALLDVRFHPAAHQDVVAVISSTRTLAIFRLGPTTNPDAPLQHIATSRCDDLAERVLFLQCNWHPTNGQIIGVTTSTGLSRLLRLDDRWKIAAVVDIDIGNSLEAWSIAFAPGPGSVAAPVGLTTVYTGGDDSVLRYNSYLLTSDYDEELVAEEPSFDPISIKGQHDAGVTAILPLALHESSGGRLVVTGSYDDHVRLFAIHDPQETYGMKRVQRLAEKNLEGGVWRLDLVDAVSSEGSVEIRILASCMYAGARLIQISQGPDGTWSCEVLARLQEHQSMNYGCAIVPRKQGDHKLVCVSTSFYDKLVCLWEYKL